jgi:hypothetical protein
VAADRPPNLALKLRSASAASRLNFATFATGTYAETMVFSATSMRKGYRAHGIAGAAFIVGGDRAE